VKIENLTMMERIQLSNQYLILARLYPDEAKYYDGLRQIVESGYTLLYGELNGTISDEMSLGECNYVYEVLDMFRFLKISFRELKDKEGLKPEDIQFPGFDGNNEATMLRFASFLKQQGKWETPLDVPGDLNAHFPTTQRYRAMLRKWHSLSDEAKHYMTAAQIKEVIAR